MDSVANLPAKQRRELFEQTAALRGFHPAIAEKDFWVCWVLMKLFESKDLARLIVFKGGTSLSKVHRLVDRFSEDIDLVLNWEVLGFGKEGKDPWEKLPSATQLDRFNREFNDRAGKYIQETLIHQVQELLASCSEVRAEVSAEDAQVISIRYPAAFSLAALRPEVKLEIGPLASWVPSGEYPICSFAAEEFPDVFKQTHCNVIALTAERTFWEKATILHQQANRQTVMPPGYSRHYYDQHQLSKSAVAERALNDLALLEDVVNFKQRFYRSPWAKYELAKPGTFRLLPTEQGNRELATDYRLMLPMFFETPPAWELITESLLKLEKAINELK